MKNRKDYVELLRSELKLIRRKLNHSTHGDSVISIYRIGGSANLSKHYEGMEYVVREVIKGLEMGREESEIERALQVNEVRFRKIIEAGEGGESTWDCYARGGLEGVGIVRGLMA